MSKRKADRQITDRDDLDDLVQEEDENGTWKQATPQQMAGRKIVKVRRGKEPVVTSSEQEKKDTETVTPTETIPEPINWPKFDFKAAVTDNPVSDTTTASTDSTSTTWPKFDFKVATVTNTEKPSVIFPTFSFATTTTTTTTTTETAPIIPITWPTFSFSPDTQDASSKPHFSFSPQPKKSDDKADGAPEVTPWKISGLGDFKQTEGTSGSVWGVNILPPKEPATAVESSAPTSTPKLAKIEKHTTGEEEEQTEFEVRAKLFEFTKNGETHTWKERGSGTLKCNFNKTTEKARLVMRTDNALRVILNATLFPTMSVEKATDKQVRFTALNSTEGTPKLGSFIARVSKVQDADTLHQTLITLKAQVKPLPTEGSRSVEEGVKETADKQTTSTETASPSKEQKETVSQ